ncbi:hypothetical protein F5146DRAFT_1018659 [Armillaria mellea]|nr:hypothetical protein F5146DRAFT_1018659 [Armillaria mellea]
MESANAYAAAMSTLLVQRVATAGSPQAPSKHPRAKPDASGEKYNPMCRKTLGKGAFLKDETLRRAKDGKIIRSPETESQSLTSLVQNGNMRHGVPCHDCPDFGGHAARMEEVEDYQEVYGTMYSYTGDGPNVEIDVDPWQLSEENRIFDMFINVEECAA